MLDHHGNTNSRSNVTGPKLNGHAQLSLMGSPQAQTGHNGVNTFGTGGSTRILRLKVMAARSNVTGPKFHAHAHLPLVGPRVVQRHKLATLASIPWAQEHPQEFQGQGHGTKVKVTEPKFNAHAHLPLMGSPQAKTDHLASNILGTDRQTDRQTELGMVTIMSWNRSMWVLIS